MRAGRCEPGATVQDHGHFGPFTSDVLGCGICVWGWVSPGFFGVGTPSGDKTTSQELIDPTVEDVVIQLDVFEGATKLWVWSPDDVPASGVAPVSENAYGVPTGYPGVWVRSDSGASGLIIRNVTFSTEHIPIPEPTSASLLIIGVAMMASIRRRRTQLNRAESDVEGRRNCR
ncbi:MAG: PEP-CTERM sorting domain-containing protein [Pirellulaceae bacterium]